MTAEERQFLAFAIGGQLCGIPALDVHDVHDVHDVMRRMPPVTPVPLSPHGILGVTNLRGRIATAISLRLRLGLTEKNGNAEGMCVVVENKGELYCLAVDAVSRVLSAVDAPLFARAALDDVWRSAVAGICRLDKGLLAVLDIPGMIESLCCDNEKEKPAEG